MSSKISWRFAAPRIALLVVAFSAIAGLSQYSKISDAYALHECKKGTGPEQVECIFRIIETRVKQNNIAQAMEVFRSAYDSYDAFVAPGCHAQAHRVGDLAYYRLYRQYDDFSKIEFPQSTTACGYGFYHGLLEHLIQDHPDPAFVDSTCTYLTERLSSTMGDIQTICYHGSGHGFMLAQSEHVPPEKEGIVSAYVRDPLKQCESLARARPGDIEQCKEGIFNVLVEWMTLGQYKFAYDTKHPFAVCDHVSAGARQACYYEMAQKLDGISNQDPQVMMAFITPIADPMLRKLSFEVGIAGIVQNKIWKPEGYGPLLRGCAVLPDEYFSPCLVSIVHGLYEHGEPEHEYEKALSVCDDTIVSEKNSTHTCYVAVASSLRRFYPQTEAAAVCALFPTAEQGSCKEQIAKSG